MSTLLCTFRPCPDDATLDIHVTRSIEGIVTLYQGNSPVSLPEDVWNEFVLRLSCIRLPLPDAHHGDTTT